MSVQTGAPERSATAWTPLIGAGGVSVGDLAAPGRVTVSAEALERLRAAMRAVIGDVDVPVGVADICPDPLVFALERGLSRPTSLGNAIDGGSSWCDLAQIEDEEFYATSTVAEVAERTTGDGRRLVRVVYETRFTSRLGVLVGVATGTSLHVGSPR